MTRKVLYSQVLLFLLILVSAVVILPAKTQAYCQERTHIWPTLIWMPCIQFPVGCPAPIDYLCCSSADECEAQNPFCNGDPKQGIRTGLGCVQTYMDINQPTVLVNQLIAWGLGLSAIAAFFLLIYGGFTMMTAQGDPKKVVQAQEIITSVVLGLLVITSAVVILNFVGVHIFGLQFYGFSF